MTAKEKAIELVDKMYGVTDYQAKKSALVAVDEILNNVMMWWEMPVKDPYFITQKKYWTEVQQEIEKL
jgi:hypothetical protein